MQTVRIGYVEIGEGRPCTIVPLTSSSIDGVMDTATSLADLPVELAEWHIDMFGEAVVETPEGLMPDLPYLLQSLAGLRTVIPVALIATFRTVEEGGSCPISDEGYVQLIKALCDSKNVDLIDIEAFHKSGRAAELIKYAHSCHIPAIASFHDYEATPEKDEIVRRLRVMQDELGADILKASVMPQSRADVLTLLAATEEMTSKYADRPVITVSMGPLGTISRVSGQTFGSAATFAHAGNKVSAPGQLSVEDTDTMLGILEDAVQG
ncbi:MAG: type I 3-dehydroquinate dehydratase [Mailhella sp.]|nr:type I 3-dehydroquinate dehydratase [Mailhella sp.]